MTLQDLFDELTYGELSQLAIGGRLDSGEPEISEADREGLILHINSALTALYSRFRLREKSVRVELTQDKSTYVLHSRFSRRNTRSTELVKYLIDTGDDEFDDQVLKIESVEALRAELNMPEHPSKLWHVLQLNEAMNPYAVRTPSPNTLLIPDSFGPDKVTPKTLRVNYRANHPPIDKYRGVAAPTAVTIELPKTHWQALLFLVASRVTNPSGMNQEFHAGNSWYAKYDSECKTLENQNMQIDNMGQTTHFERQGFV